MKRSRAVQTDLFGIASDEANASRAPSGNTESRERRGVEPASVSDALRTVAEELPRTLHMGTSSWAFPGWRSLVYGGDYTSSLLSREGLRAYAQHPLLRAVGIDRTFYAPISAQAFEQYAQAVPDDFRFLVKAHAAVTTPRGARMAGQGRAQAPTADRFLDAAYATTEVVEPALRGLGKHLGVVLFQFPPLSLSARRLDALPDALGEFLQALPQGVAYAVEVRNAELLGPHYAHALSAGGATHCFTVHPSMPSIPVQCAALEHGVVHTGPAVIRWMLGHGREYAEARDAYAPFDALVAPDLTTRIDVASLIAELNAKHRPTIVIANNKAEGSAPRTLMELAQLVAGHRQ